MKAGWSLVRLACRIWCGETPSYDQSCQTSTDYRHRHTHCIRKHHFSIGEILHQYRWNISQIQIYYSPEVCINTRGTLHQLLHQPSALLNLCTI